MHTHLKIICVDDEPYILKSLKRIMAKEKYYVKTAENGDEALKLFCEEKFDIAIIDMRMPGMTGLELISRVRIISPSTKIIVLTAYPEIQNAVTAIKYGAFDYIEKPYIENVLISIKKIIEFASRENEPDIKSNSLYNENSFAGIVGKSDVMLKVFALIQKVAQKEIPVLIIGETGSGKELIARAIHTLSSRSEQPFVTVDCSSLTHSVVESELFGHLRGAFTGATEAKTGLLSLADGGSIFLDEISEIPINIQGRLLRATQDSEIRPVGSNHYIKFDARIISATNRNLEDEIKSANFRADLFYRLNVVKIIAPPLRERAEDIPLLIEYFISKHKHLNPKVNNFTNEALNIFYSYGWPGNVRELENAVRLLISINDTDFIDIKQFPKSLLNTMTGQSCKQDLDTGNLKENEIILIKKTLQECGGDKEETARRLGISLSTIYRKLSD